jgi:alpha-galactosidase
MNPTSTTHDFPGQFSSTQFRVDHGTPYLPLLGNLPLLPDSPGFIFEADSTPVQFLCTRTEFGPNTAFFTWTGRPDSGWSFNTRWTFDAATDCWHRADSVTRSGTTPARIYDFAARWSLPAACYSAYVQHSAWANENQGAWHALAGGTLIIDSKGGRTTQTHTPYLFLRDDDSGLALVWHLVPNGNWFIRIRSAIPALLDSPARQITVEVGLGDRQFRPLLNPGQSLALPEIIIQAAPGSDPESACVRLHRHLHTQYLPAYPRPIPSVYNTWFDAFDSLEVPRLRQQLATARELGFEIFTVDAGWYGGAIDQPWHLLVGHWEEKQSAAFYGRMREFADEVRAAGLGFGLWMEPERFGSGAPIRKQHPDWFVDAGGGFAHIDLTLPDAYAWVRSEIGRLVETYRLAWMKIDYNFELGPDPHQAAHVGYFQAWHALLAELPIRYPDTTFEACASGAMRMDLAMARLHPFHFISDTVNPVDQLRIFQGALLRLPPGRSGFWSVLRSIGNTIPDYGKPLDQAQPKIVVPCGGVWDPAQTVDPDFALHVACLGMFGMSGDLMNLPESVRDRIRLHLDFFKVWRRFIHTAEVTPLVPARPKSDRSGWLAFHYQQPGNPDSLLYVFRLQDVQADRSWRLPDLDSSSSYSVRPFDRPESEAVVFTGQALRQTGVRTHLPTPQSAQTYILRKCG